MSPVRLPTTTPARLISWILVGLVIAAALIYFLFQARFIIAGPQISLDGEMANVQTERVITLNGTAANVTALYLNGRPIVTDETGVFREKVILENGYTIVRLEAVDRYGRHTYLERSFVYKSSL